LWFSHISIIEKIYYTFNKTKKFVFDNKYFN